MSSPRSERTAAPDEHQDELPSKSYAPPMPDQLEHAEEQEPSSSRGAGSLNTGKTAGANDAPEMLLSSGSRQATDRSHPSSEGDAEFAFKKYNVTTAAEQPVFRQRSGSLYNGNHFQSDIDAQIYSEASMSDQASERDSPVPESAGHQEPSSGIETLGGHHSPSLELRHVPSRPAASRIRKQRMVFAAKGSAFKRSKSVQHAPRPNLTTERPSTASDDTDTADLLKVVSFKFHEKENKLNSAFAVEREELQTELQQIRNDRDTISGQLQDCRTQCKDLASTVEAHRARLKRAKGLSKFLDGLGIDLQRYRNEQEKYQATITNARELDLADFEERLAAREELEHQLHTAKTTLEKLVQAKDCEVQVVVEHRDSLKRQLEEKIGQLVEERDRCSRLEQKIAALETSNQAGIASALTNFRDALAQRHTRIDQQQDSMTAEMADIRTAVFDIANSPTASAEDCAAILTALSKTECSVVEQCKALATAARPSPNDIPADQKPLLIALRSLQTDIAGLKSTFEHQSSNVAPDVDLQDHLRQAFERSGHLEAQLGASRTAEAKLTEEVAKLAAQVKSANDTSTTTATSTTTEKWPSEDEVKKLIHAAELKVRQQFSESAKAFQAEERAKSDNEIKRLANERDRVRADVQAKAAESQALSNEVKRLKLNRTSSESESQRRIEELSSALQNLQQEAHRSSEQCTALEGQLSTLAAEKETIEESANALQNLKAELSRELQDSKESLAEARTAQKAAISTGTKHRAESEAAIGELQRKLHAAEDDNKKLEMGNSQLKLSCQKAFDVECEKYRKQEQALQERIAEVECEADDRVREGEEKVRRSTEEHWGHELATWQTRISELEGKLAAEQAVREEAASLATELREERDALLTEMTRLQSAQQAIGASEQPCEETRLTPTDSHRNAMPAKPRKKADRNTNTIIEARPVPAPEVLRPRCRTSDADQLCLVSRELEVPDSQLQVVVPKISSKEALLMPAPPAKLIQKSSDSDEMLDTEVQPQLPVNAQSLVPETQLADTLTNFAAFKSSLSSSSARQSASLPSQSYGRSSYFPQRRPEPSDSSSQRDQQQGRQPPSPGFQIYEDPHSSYSKDRSQGLTDDDFVFHKAMPKPNSASKRVARTVSDNTAYSQQSYRPPAKYQTPDLSGPTNGFAARPQDRPRYASKALGSDGSTPPFMKRPLSKKTQQYHGSSGDKAKRRTSQRSTTPLPDPRLAARAAGHKRAAERNEESLEQQPLPKRRMTQAAAVPPAPARRIMNDGVISRASQSVNDLPRISDVLARRPGNNDQSRMRTFGGQPSRTTGRSKKLSKNDEYSVRFSQELGRR